jgi:hypothetical protein
MATMLNVPATRGRCSLVSMDEARVFVRGALAVGDGGGTKKKAGKKEGRVIVEAFPGELDLGIWNDWF